MGEAGPEAAVYNSFPLNDCPADLWAKLDAHVIAEKHGAVAALLNGPRYWLMNGIEKQVSGPQKTTSFGGIEMVQQAVVQLSSMNPAPYSVNRVDRKAIFVFDAGQPIFELIDPAAQRWVMQTWSQTIDADLGLDDLPGLANRLNLPGGWVYQSRILSEPLHIDTTVRPAHVLQDDLANSYSLQF